MKDEVKTRPPSPAPRLPCPASRQLANRQVTAGGRFDFIGHRARKMTFAPVS